MSGCLSSWIQSYLLNVAETHGANLSSVPFSCKKKVQLIDFLTFGSTDLNKDDLLWGIVSDKNHHLPVRFSQEAVAEYRKLHKRRFTEVKTALITLSTFRVLFSRVPLLGGGVSRQSTLVFECTGFSLLGSIGEPRFSLSTEIENDPDLKEWIDGLRHGGGGGNILKERKRELTLKSNPETAQPQKQSSKTSAARVLQSKVSVPQIPDIITAGPSSRRRAAPSGSGLGKTDSFERERERQWIAVAGKSSWRPKRRKDIGELVEQLPEHGETDNDQLQPNLPRKRRKLSHPLLSSQPEAAPSPPHRSRSQSSSSDSVLVSNWSASERDELEWPPPVDVDCSVAEDEGHPSFSSPTPEQRRSTVPRAPSPSGSEAPKGTELSHRPVPSPSTGPSHPISSPLFSQLQQLPRTHQTITFDKPKPSDQSQGLDTTYCDSPPPPAQSTRAHPGPAQSDVELCSQAVNPSNTSIDKAMSPSPSRKARVTSAAQASMTRKVPPPQPLPMPGGNSQSPKILAPNSDTSGTQSQSQSQSQSHSQFHSQSQKPMFNFHSPISDSKPERVADSEPLGAASVIIIDINGTERLSLEKNQSRGQDNISVATSLDVHPGSVMRQPVVDPSVVDPEKVLSGSPTGDDDDEDDSLFGSNSPLPRHSPSPNTSATIEEVQHDPNAWSRPSFQRPKELDGGATNYTAPRGKGLTYPTTSSDSAGLTKRQSDDQRRENSEENTASGSDKCSRGHGTNSRISSNSCNEAALRKDLLPPPGRLGGFEVGLDDVQIDSEGLWMSWKRLAEIGLATRRGRFESFQQSGMR
ncbi:hypothetical protein D9758_001856 [Tetrapyrgos nigripes]|uniref:Shelterin complex subunit TPP1/Est3 domain-containing protein n=1 Tax=Tetrapyrgos nigripes TaxID=182062 RepID=A0A8H5LV25_9AGAR|nr:hypothetical protein D9758_001856 [Tetrapyrgos nigripes]